MQREILFNKGPWKFHRDQYDGVLEALLEEAQTQSRQQQQQQQRS